MKTMTIVGTRPELIKMSEIIKKLDRFTEHILVHTGQNFDYELNGIFYNDLKLRKPDFYLEVGGGTLTEQIARVIDKTGPLLELVKPDAVIILGDTNSALSGIIAKRYKIPLFHLEAGNRCFDDNVPEEINRRILDHIADVNMVYSEHSRRYLLSEGIAKDRLFLMGSPMQEVIATHLDEINAYTPKYKRGKYFVASIHRDENINIKENFYNVIDSLNAIAEEFKLPIILTVHPRLRKKLEEESIVLDDRIEINKPFGFIEYVGLQSNAKCVISDSGTISEESAIMAFPAVTIRNAIERPEALDTGSIIMSGVKAEDVIRAIKVAVSTKRLECPVDYDLLNCSDRVVKIILGYVQYVRRNVWHAS